MSLDVTNEQSDSQSAEWIRLEGVVGTGPASDGAIGLVCLSNDIAIEGEFRAFLPRSGVGIYAARMPKTRASTLASLHTLDDRIAAAASRIVPDDRLDVIAVGCTSGAAAIGLSRVAEIVGAVRPGIPVTDPMSACMRALKALGAERLAVLTPYQDAVNTVIARTLTAHGFRLATCAGFYCPDGAAMSRLAPEALLAAAERIAGDADALFIPCTALVVSPIIEALEAAVRRPVVTSNQALAWDAMRLAGIAPEVAADPVVKSATAARLLGLSAPAATSAPAGS